MRVLLILLFCLSPVAASAEDLKSAIFAGGCFWCVESDFDLVEGVAETTSGYTGGAFENPSYKDVTHKDTGHREAVLVRYDPEVVSYEELLHHFWRSIDPLDPNGQFCDKGDSYKSAIYTVEAAQFDAATASKAELAMLFELPVATDILTTEKFWPAEDYHQDYYLKNPIRYNFYRSRCGRDKRVEEVWGDEAIDRSGHS